MDGWVRIRNRPGPLQLAPRLPTHHQIARSAVRSGSDLPLLGPSSDPRSRSKRASERQRAWIRQANFAPSLSGKSLHVKGKHGQTTMLIRPDARHVLVDCRAASGKLAGSCGQQVRATWIWAEQRASSGRPSARERCSPGDQLDRSCRVAFIG